MTWYRQVDWAETAFIFIFIAFYALYIFRTYRLAQQLHSTSKYIYIKFVLRSSYFVLLIMALLGPSFGEVEKEIKSVGKDIFICIDLSQSMNANDVQPSRLSKVKFEVEKIIDAFSSDKIGIIIFSSEAFVQCPLTNDQAASKLFLSIMHTGLVPSTGTDFAPPLEMALEKHLAKQENKGVQNSAKVVILISDGEDFGDETQSAIDEIKKEGIKLFTLGVGTEKGGKIPLNRGFKFDQNGEDIITKLNPDDLQDLAEQTDGKYFEISDKRNDTKRLINSINQIEGELRDTKKLDVSANKYYYLLYIALFLIAIDVLFTVRVLKI